MSGIKQPSHLLDRESLGQVMPLTRGVQLGSDIRRDNPLRQRILMQPSDSGRRARYGRRCCSFSP